MGMKPVGRRPCRSVSSSVSWPLLPEPGSVAALQRLKPGKGDETEKQQNLVKNNMVINYQQWLKE